MISGDTTPSDNLIQLARGADVLVHEAIYLPAIDRIAARVPGGARLKEHILRSHTSAEDAGHVGGRVRVARLTPAGLSERSLLDERSNDLAASILALKHADIREAYKAFRDKQSAG